MKISGRIKFVLFLIAISLILSAVIAFAAPGDSNDPLITLSYITETLIPEIDARVDQRVIKRVDEAMANHNFSDSFVLVNTRQNQSIIGEEGTEFVVRAGSGVIVATANGGIADLTAGSDIAAGYDIPLNHHLLVPRTDSRGIRFTTDGIVLIKGAYTVSTK